MLSKNQLRLIKGLRKKKNRLEEGLFIAEGVKLVNELLDSRFKPYKIYCTEEYQRSLDDNLMHLVTQKELKGISELSSPNQVLGLFHIPIQDELNRKGLTVALDDLNDPGNLGTIIRLCDWFDVQQLVCSNNTADCFNQKVVQASMGSLARVSIVYTDLENYLEQESRPVYGTFMQGENLYGTPLQKDCVLVMGNEAKGISKTLEAHITDRLSIPQFGIKRDTESLNVAMATAIFLSELRR